MDAMGQLFYSISVAMGIMVTYGSYFKDKDNLMRSVNQIEIFDTVVAFLAGVMVIPAVYVFSGAEGMSSGGPGLMFMMLPKVFAEMGVVGRVVGVPLASAESNLSHAAALGHLECIVDKTKIKRKKMVIIEGVIAFILAVIICFGYNKNIFFFNVKLPNGANAQLLDIFDFVSNNILMPIVAIGTCILVGWIIKPKTIIEEATKNGERMFRKGLYVVMVKVVTPILLCLLLLASLGIIKI